MAKRLWLDLHKITSDLDKLFRQSQPQLSRFGNTVNQVFEAFVFAQVVAWHSEQGWDVTFAHPKEVAPGAIPELKLKFNTRGKPSNYSYARCVRGGEVRQIRHGLRVMTHAGSLQGIARASIVLDVSVIRDIDLSKFDSNTAVSNTDLITFGEAKHMAAFAELIASFLGLVAEMQPRRVRPHSRQKQARQGLLPFLFVSAYLMPTADGIKQTIDTRGFAIDVYTRTNELAKGLRLSTKPAPLRNPTTTPGNGLSPHRSTGAVTAGYSPA